MASNAPKRTFDEFAEPNNASTSGSLSPKRPRPQFPSPHLWGSKLWDMIVKLPPETTNAILFNACQHDSIASTAIQAAHSERLAQLAAEPPVNFDAISRNCSYILNRKYARSSGSKQYDAVADIESELSDARDEILLGAGPDTRWETRRNALEVLRKCAKSVMLCEQGPIRHELMKDGVELAAWADAMVEVAKGMSEEEREKYKKEGLYAKLVELQGLCDWEADMEGLRDVYEIFDGDADEDEDDEDEEDENQDQDEEEASGDDEGQDDFEESIPTSSEPIRTMPLLVDGAERSIPRRTSVFTIGDLL